MKMLMIMTIKRASMWRKAWPRNQFRASPEFFCRSDGETSGLRERSRLGKWKSSSAGSSTGCVGPQSLNQHMLRFSELRHNTAPCDQFAKI